MGYSAADVERFTYCPLSWWLSREGYDGDTPELGRGIRRHAEKGTEVARWRRILREHGDALRTAFYMVLVAASAATLGIEFLYLHGAYTAVLMVMSLVWLLVSLGFLVTALRKEDDAGKLVHEAGFVPGELTYSDLDAPGATLRSARYELGGRPDYIVRDGAGLIPVELKTGATPAQPHESHVMQVATYCVLVEETYGRRPPFGVVSYEGGRFEIPYTEALKDRVLETVLRMKLAEVTGKVHRNHERPGKCLGCSRRAACPERLA